MPPVLSLPQRAHCTQCRCHKTLFQEENDFRETASQADEPCRCHHPWWQHIASSVSAQAGPCAASGCGGYYPVDNSLPTNATCVCNQPYDAHELNTEAQVEADSNPAAAIARSAPGLAYANVRAAGAQPWIRPLTAAAAATANQERVSAMTRHRRPAAASRAPTPLAPTVQLKCVIWPFVLQKALSYPDYPPPEPSFTIRSLGEVVECLFNHNLIFPITLDRTNEHPWKDIDAALHQHLAIHGFVLQRREGDNGNTFNRLSWDVMSKKKIKEKLKFHTGAADFGTFTISFLSKEAIQVDTQQDSNNTPVLFLAPTVANLRGPVSQGPLKDRAHACMPWRLFAPLGWLVKTDPEEGNVCIPGFCPSPDDAMLAVNVRRTSSPTPAMTSHRSRSLSPAPPPNTRPRLASPANIQRAPSPIPTVTIPRPRSRSLSPAPPLRNTRPRLASPLVSDDEDDIDELPKLSAQDLETWQGTIRAQAGNKRYQIRAPKIEDASNEFIRLLTQLFSGTSPLNYVSSSPGIISCSLKDTDQLLYPVPPFQIGTAADAAVGDGPAGAVYHGALGTRVEHPRRWVDINGTYRTLNLCTLAGLETEASIKEYKIDGAITALALVHLMLEPYPITPFLVYAAFFSGPRCLDFLARESEGDYKRTHLLQMVPDKETRKVVEAVCTMKRTDIVHPGQVATHPVCSRAIALGVEATFFANPRDEGQHVSIVRKLLAELLVGHPEPWGHRQFRAFAAGFRLKFSNTNDFIKLHSAESDTQLDIYAYAFKSILRPRGEAVIDNECFECVFKFIATIWNNRIKSYLDITERLDVVCLNEPQHSSIKAMIYARLFLTRFHRWIQGIGHPPELVGTIISKKMYRESLESPEITRPLLFWNAISDVNVLPVIGIKSIFMQLIFTPHPVPEKAPVPLKFSACLKTLTVTMSPDVLNRLLEPGDLHDQSSTLFDKWFHALVAHAAKDYNSF